MVGISSVVCCVPLRRVGGLVAGLAVLLVVPVGAGAAPPGTIPLQGTVDTGLCGFPIESTILDAQKSHVIGAATLTTGFAKVVLTNLDTGQTATLNASSPTTVTSSGALEIRGHEVYVTGNSFLPYESTDGPVSFSPEGVLSSANNNAQAVDPCALVGPSATVRPATTLAPWGLSSDALSHMAYAGLVPILGTLVRHDHVHLDVIIDGQQVAVPAGIGMAEPVDEGAPAGPCLQPTTPPGGDCVSGDFYDGFVADSPLHTHTASGIIHIETDRQRTFTLGQFFDEWGVRLTQDCIGGYCSGGQNQLRVYVNGTQVAGDPADMALTNLQEIAIIYGGPGDFGSVPSTYTLGWPSPGCGGTNEPHC